MEITYFSYLQVTERFGNSVLDMVVPGLPLYFNLLHWFYFYATGNPKNCSIRQKMSSRRRTNQMIPMKTIQNTIRSIGVRMKFALVEMTNKMNENNKCTVLVSFLRLSFYST